MNTNTQAQRTGGAASRSIFEQLFARLQNTVASSSKGLDFREIIISDYTGGGFKPTSARSDDFDNDTAKLSEVMTTIENLLKQDIEVIQLSDVFHNFYINVDDLIADLTSGCHIYLRMVEGDNVDTNRIIRDVDRLIQHEFMVFTDRHAAVAFKLALVKA